MVENGPQPKLAQSLLRVQWHHESSYIDRQVNLSMHKNHQHHFSRWSLHVSFEMLGSAVLSKMHTSSSCQLVEEHSRTANHCFCFM